MVCALAHPLWRRAALVLSGHYVHRATPTCLQLYGIALLLAELQTGGRLCIAIDRVWGAHRDCDSRGHVSRVLAGADSLTDPPLFGFVSGRVCVASEEWCPVSQHTDVASHMAHDDCLSPSLSNVCCGRSAMT